MYMYIFFYFHIVFELNFRFWIELSFLNWIFGFELNFCFWILHFSLSVRRAINANISKHFLAWRIPGYLGYVSNIWNAQDSFRRNGSQTLIKNLLGVTETITGSSSPTLTQRSSLPMRETVLMQGNVSKCWHFLLCVLRVKSARCSLDVESQKNWPI